MEPSTQLMSGDNEHDEALRFNYLTQHFSQLTFAAAPYNETFNICKDLLDDGSKKVASALKSVMLSRAAKLDGTQVASNFHASDVPPTLSSNTLDKMSQFKLLDPNVSKTKGRRKAEKDNDHEVSEEDDTEDDDSQDYELGLVVLTLFYIYLQLINEKPQIIQEFWMTVGKKDNWMTVDKQDNWMTV
ncbi:hypothetical protein Dimus_034028 [Dionaea muscipula]